jgi:two-component system, OmpR family, sensor histidine kinase KdpD
MARGTLIVYLGAAPGVGKTFAMLDEGWRRRERGTDVVVGFVETHGRLKTQAQLRDLEVVPRRQMEYRGASFQEMDVGAVLARRPHVALVDELAHTNVPGSRNEKRWQDIDELLDAGITVISTVNIQHLESLNDVVEQITGVVQRETVPDEWVRRADQIQLVDMSPEALRRRMAHGNIYPAERVDAALANYFRVGNLAALRELALLWVADRVEEGLQRYMDTHGITDSWETRERVVVAITGAPGGDDVIRRASRMAMRRGGELVGVHVVASDGLANRRGPLLDEQRILVGQLGGTYREVVGDDVPKALADFAHGEKATQMVLGASRRSRWSELVRGSVVSRVLRQVKGVDVHVISVETPERIEPGARRSWWRVPPWLRRVAPLPLRRQVGGAVLAATGLPVLIGLLVILRDDLVLSTALLVVLAFTVVVTAIGGVIVGAATALVSSLAVNWFLVPPYGTFTIAEAENLVALIVFVAVAVTLGIYVDRTAARSRDSRRARAEAEVLATTTATLLGSPEPVQQLVEQIRAAFAVDAVALLNRSGDTWAVLASSGEPAPVTPFDGVTWDIDLAPESVLVLRGDRLGAEDQRLLRSFLTQLAIALESRRLHATAASATDVAAGDALRTALLQAVSHDLRTPLASIKASVTGLLQPDVTFTDRERREFLVAIDTETDRLDRLVGNLLDMSRLQASAVEIDRRPVFLEDVVASALSTLPGGKDEQIQVDVPETLSPVLADPALLERAVANVVSNALAWCPIGKVVRIEAGEVGARVHLRVVDEGPGVKPPDRARVFEPFQRLGDQSTHEGVGLGLAVARGFVDAIGGELTLDDTPGGGLTVTIELEVAA